MTYALTWLADVLQAANLKVAETPGWRSRGVAEMGTVRGVICHHTAVDAPGNMPSLNVLIGGRSDLRGPLAQLGLGRDGTFYVVAAGKANHAGPGKWSGIVTGNTSFIGIEAEHDSNPRTPWPEVQMEAYRHGVAAILEKIGAGADMVCGHKEYALPLGRKQDPFFDMHDFRVAVANILSGAAPPPALIAANDGQGHSTLRRGAQGDAVAILQKALSITADGIFGAGTEAAVRQFQVRAGLVPDGIVGPETWARLNVGLVVVPPLRQAS